MDQRYGSRKSTSHCFQGQQTPLKVAIRFTGRYCLRILSNLKSSGRAPETRRGIRYLGPSARVAHMLFVKTCLSVTCNLLCALFPRVRTSPSIFVHLSESFPYDLPGQANKYPILPSVRYPEPYHTAELCDTTNS